jgi:hypothetical protein
MMTGRYKSFFQGGKILVMKRKGLFFGILGAIGIGCFAFAALSSRISPVSVNASTSTVASFMRNNTTDATTGGTFSTNCSAKTGYYQDNSTATDYYVQVLNTSAWLTSSPTSLSISATLGAGTTKASGVGVKVALLNSSGTVLGDAVTLTDEITTTAGSSFSVNLPTANWATLAGIKIYHTKISGWNLRFYSFSLTATSDVQHFATNLSVTTNTPFNEGAYFAASDIYATATYDGTANTDYTNFSAEIGTTTSGVYTKRETLVVGTSVYKEGDNTIRITALDPTTAGGSSYSSVDTTIVVNTVNKYSLVTDISQLRLDSEIVFANNSNLKAMKNAAVAAGTWMDVVSPTILDSKVYATTNLGVFKLGIGTSKDSYTFKNTLDSKYLYAADASKSYLELQATNTIDGEWTIAIDSSDYSATIKAQGTHSSPYLEYYSTYSEFTLYSSVPSTAATKVFIYQIAPTNGVLSSVSVETQPTKTSYKAGEYFSSDGIKLTGTFNDALSTQVDLTSWASYSPSVIAADTTKVVASISVLGVVKTADIAIVVNTATLSGIAVTTPATKLDYFVGDALDTSGIVVTATYSDNTTSVVTSSCTFSPVNNAILNSVGETTVTITLDSATTSYVVSVTQHSDTISKSGSSFTFSSGNLPNYWDQSGAVSYYTTKTVFKAAGNYFQVSKLVPSVSTDVMTTIGIQVYSVVNSATLTDVITVSGLKDGTEISGATVTFSPINFAVTSADTIDAACSEANSKKVYISGSGINGIKLTLTTKNANWVVNSVTLSYFTEDETFAYNFLQATNICDPTGQANNVTNAIWAAQQTAYTNLSSDTFRTSLKGASANATGTILEQCAARYDYIVKKYGEATFANFMARTVAPSGANALGKDLSSSSEWLLPSILLLSTISAGAFFFLAKKKKHNA